MLNFTVYTSGSAGNLYKLDDGKSEILIEAGLPIKKIRKKLEFKLSEVAGCLISHEHL